MASHASVAWVNERHPDHKISPPLASPLAHLQHLRERDSEASEWVLWSEEFHRDLEDWDDETRNKQLKRRSSGHLRRRHARFKEDHAPLQQQLMGRQSLFVTLFAQTARNKASSKERSNISSEELSSKDSTTNKQAHNNERREKEAGGEEDVSDLIEFETKLKAHLEANSVPAGSFFKSRPRATQSLAFESGTSLFSESGTKIST